MLAYPVTEAPLAGDVHGCLLVSVAVVYKPRHVLLCAVLLTSEMKAKIKITMLRTMYLCITLITASVVSEKLLQQQQREELSNHFCLCPVQFL